MTGHKRDGLGVVAMGERHISGGGASGRGGDARADENGDVCVPERFQLLTPATENKGVAAFEAHNHFSLARQLDQARLDFFLGHGVVRLRLAHIEPVSVTAGEVENLVADQTVVKNDVGALEKPQRLDG